MNQRRSPRNRDGQLILSGKVDRGWGSWSGKTRWFAIVNANLPCNDNFSKALATLEFVSQLDTSTDAGRRAICFIGLFALLPRHFFFKPPLR